MLRKKIFTLLELLIVIAIIAILAALLLPALQSARNKANAIACTGNLKSFVIALSGYQNAFDGFLPGRTEGSAGEYNASGSRSWFWCVRDEIGKEAFRKLKCPSHPERGTVGTTYKMNTHIGFEFTHATPKTFYRDPRRVKNPTGIVTFTENPVSGGYNLWMSGSTVLGEYHRLLFANASFLDGHIGIVMGKRANDGKLNIQNKNLIPE